MLQKSLLIIASAAVFSPWSVVVAASSINESRAADPQGTVDVFNVAGTVHVQGWDKAQVEVIGTGGKDVDRVEITGSADHTSVRVVLRPSHRWNTDGEAHLTIHVPQGSSLMCKTVSADVKIDGVHGESTLKTVSGDVDGEVGGDVNAHAVSGTIHLKATAAKTIEVQTVSGDADIIGGNGEIEVTTVSGDAKIKMATTGRVRLQTVSGTMSAALGLTADAHVDAQAVSGDLKLEFPSTPAADFDVETFSGEIDNCFGPKPDESHHGSGSTLKFKNGDGSAHVRVNTHSGSVTLCTR